MTIHEEQLNQSDMPEQPAAEPTPQDTALLHEPDPLPIISETVMPAPTKQVEAQEIPLSLDEFCRRLSLEDRRTVLIGGFHLKMRQAKRGKDTDAAWRAAFDQFVKS